MAEQGGSGERQEVAYGWKIRVYRGEENVEEAGGEHGIASSVICETS